MGGYVEGGYLGGIIHMAFISVTWFPRYMVRALGSTWNALGLWPMGAGPGPTGKERQRSRVDGQKKEDKRSLTEGGD